MEKPRHPTRLLGEPLHILLVEDEPAHAEAVRRSLLGADPTTVIRIAGSLREYAEAVAAHPPDLAILDLLLPDGRADSVLQSPPEDGAFPQVLMTSHGDEQAAVRAIQQGALDYIVKSPEAFAQLPHSVDQVLRSWQLLMDRKQAQRALRESEERYRRLFEAESDAILVVDCETGRLVDVNESAVRLYGYARPEFLQKAAWDVSAEPERTQRSMRQKETLVPLRQHRKQDGTVFPVEISGGYFESQGRKLHVATVRDMTERRRAEEAVREGMELQDQFAKVAATVPGLVYSFRLGPDGRTSMPFTTPTILELFGLRPEDVREDATALLNLIHPDDRAGVLEGIKESARTMKPWRQMFRVSHPRQNERWAEGHSVPRLEPDGSVLWHGFVQDVTEHKLSAEALAVEVTRRRILIEGSRDGIVVLNQQGRVHESNRKFAEMLGYSPAELRELRVWDWEFQHTQEQVEEMIRAVGPAGDHFETVHRRKDGSVYPVEISSNAAVLDGQKLIFCVCRDITERKRAEQALQESAERLRLALDAARLGTFDADLVANRVTWSPRHQEIWGQPLGKLAGEVGDFLRQVYPEDRAGIQAVWEQCVASRSPFQHEYRVVWPDGSLHWVEAAGEFAFDASGRPTRLRGVVLETTQRRQAERFHALGAEVLTLLNQEMPGKQTTQRILDAIKRETGFDAVGVRLQDGDDFPYQGSSGFSADFIAAENSLVLRTREGGLCRDAQGKVRLECTCGMILSGQTDPSHPLFTSTGSAWTNDARSFLHVPAQADLRLNPRNRCMHEGYQSVALIPIRVKQEIIGLLQLNDRRQNCFTLRTIQFFEGLAASFGVALMRQREEQRLRQLSLAVEQSPASIVITDPKGLIEYVNPKFTQVTGYTREEVLGQSPRVLKSGDMPPEGYATLWQTILAGKEWRGEFHNRRKSGELFWESASISPITDDAGRITHFVAVKEDITERKQLEAQLRQAQKLEAIGQLAGGVAHDFNNILAAILLHLGILQMKPALEEEIRHALKDLDGEARRAATLTRQLLMFSRRSVLAVKPLDLNEVIAQLLKMLDRLIGEHIDLRFDGKTSLPAVEADAGLLEQVLMNLVVNARDAMPNGGRITIATRGVRLDADQTRVNRERRPGRFVCLAVSDTGTGMDAETMKRIFEPFFTTKEAGKGTGLGLATVYGIVAQHKGWVEVESQPGRGTSFQVFLPALEQPVGPPAQPVDAEPVRRGHETVLLVEDDAKVRQLVGRSLRVLGYNVYEAQNGREAIQLWPTLGTQVDLLLTDMVMPEGMTGLELSEQLQASKPGLKVIISSGYSAEFVQAGEPTKAGVVYLPKPYEAKKLAEVLRQCLDRTA